MLQKVVLNLEARRQSRRWATKCQPRTLQPHFCSLSPVSVRLLPWSSPLWSTSDRRSATGRRAKRSRGSWGGCSGTGRRSSSSRSTGAFPTTAWMFASSGPPKTTGSWPPAAAAWPWLRGFTTTWSISATARCPGPGTSWLCPDLCRGSAASCASALRTGLLGWSWVCPSVIYLLPRWGVCDSFNKDQCVYLCLYVSLSDDGICNSTQTVMEKCVCVCEQRTETQTAPSAVTPLFECVCDG